MSGLQALQSTRFVTVDGRRLAVMDAGDWEAVVEWLGSLEDAGIAAAARSITSGGARRPGPSRLGHVGQRPRRPRVSDYTVWVTLPLTLPWVKRRAPTPSPHPHTPAPPLPHPGHQPLAVAHALGEAR
jgi:hypothetical protein